MKNVIICQQKHYGPD